MIAETIVTYPDGDTSSEGEVLHVALLEDGRSAVVVDTTAFHPVDTAWPDQPADRGVLRTADGREVPIVDGVVGASQHGEFVFGPAVSVRTGTEGWTFVVAHVVEDATIAVGDTVTIEADAAYRDALSRGHTACHLASLALDAALADAWRKDTQLDALGAPAFDALAIQESRIHPDGSRDVYRIGKSLRRKGFDPSVLEDTAVLATRVDSVLAEWVATQADVRIEREGRALADRRTWVCALPESAVRIPCGGTHVTSLADLSAVSVTFDVGPVEGGLELVMTTKAVAAR